MIDPFLAQRVATGLIIRNTSFIGEMFNAVSNDPQAAWYLVYAGAPAKISVLRLNQGVDVADHRRIENIIARHSRTEESETTLQSPPVLWALIKTRVPPHADYADYLFKQMFGTAFATPDQLKPPVIPDGAVVSRDFDETVLMMGMDSRRASIFRYPITRILTVALV